mmetsp:Transcript_15103/g.53013  ORF Transcript_15103/g.53013 Transcript_15103/m.53013 type:complete len:237 (+) Transcript_15103:477-1187(+)
MRCARWDAGPVAAREEPGTLLAGPDTVAGTGVETETAAGAAAVAAGATAGAAVGRSSSGRLASSFSAGALAAAAENRALAGIDLGQPSGTGFGSGGTSGSAAGGTASAGSSMAKRRPSAGEAASSVGVGAGAGGRAAESGGPLRRIVPGFGVVEGEVAVKMPAWSMATMSSRRCSSLQLSRAEASPRLIPDEMSDARPSSAEGSDPAGMVTSSSLTGLGVVGPSSSSCESNSEFSS